jgi:glycosyltransferase involved in cell wall biosynthesis
LLKWLFPRVKFVHTIHSEARAESRGRIKALVRKIFFKKGYCTAVTISRASDCSFHNFYGENVKSVLICNGRPLSVALTNNNLIPQLEDRYNFVSIGHISPVKNHILLCSAVDQLIQRGEPIELYMFGRFADESIVNSIKALNNPHIHMIGEVENPRQYLRNADVYCMSSVIEGMPISLIEALSCGLIPICTAVGGIVDMVIDGETGFLSHDLTVESYAKAIERFLSLSEKEVVAIKQRCQESAKQYSIEICTQRYVDLFNSLLSV